MSHFVVIVVGENPEDQLAPFQEEGSGDIDRKYLEFVDHEDEHREQYEKEGAREFYCASSSSWGMCVPEPIFNQVWGQPEGRRIVLDSLRKTGLNYWKLGEHYRLGLSLNNKYPEKQIWVKCTKILETQHPDKNVCFCGKIQVEVVAPPKEIPHKTRYPTFEEFMSDWHGESRDPEKGRYGRWHNPNAKWDWFQIGGRWAGFFKAMPGVEKARGENGLMNSCGDFDADQIRIKDVDFEGMRLFRRAEAKAQYEKVYAALGDTPLPPSWSSIREKHSDENIDTAREEYNSLPGVQILKKADLIGRHDDINETYGCSLREFMDRAERRTAVPFAVLINGKWHEKGSMGWWGCVSDEKDQDKWNEEVQKLYAGLPPDTLLTCVDCHI